jgi:nicotinate-nucleotide adenylyltransferase
LLVCYGGTFDPVHNGHLAIACAIRDGLDAEVHLIPAADPPHKGPTHADAEQRAAMLELAVDGMHRLQVDRRELRRDGPSYTIDTLRELRTELGPDMAIAWLIGSDSLLELHTWRHWRALFDVAHIIAVQRPGSQVDAEQVRQVAPDVHTEIAPRWSSVDDLGNAPAGRFAVFPLDRQREESSTELRRRIRLDLPWQDWVPAAVAGYIAQHGLYRERGLHPASL